MTERNGFAEENEEVVFRRVMKGYSPAEVDEYIMSLKADAEALKAENAELSRRLKAAGEEIEKYKKSENDSDDIKRLAAVEASRVIEEAKSRAAHIIMRTNNQCSRIVSDMVSQVEEQKKIYSAAKKEAKDFRTRLFIMYKEHIEKINAFSEAAGVSDKDALDREELEKFSSIMSDDGYDTNVSAEVRSEIEKIKRQTETAEKRPETSAVKDRRAYAVRTAERASTEKEESVRNEKNDEADKSWKVGEAPFESSFDSDKSVSSEKEDVTIDGSSFGEQPEINRAEANPSFYLEDNEKSDMRTADADFSGLGDKAKNDDADDDSDEFYSENDDEFYPSARSAIPTGTLGSIGIDTISSGEKAKSSKWKVRKAMSITDEFDIVGADDSDE